MPEIVGAVQCIRTGDDFGFTMITEQDSGISEAFILWWAGEITPADPPASTRIMQSEWISLLRQGMASNIPVTITVGVDDSALVLNVQLGIGGGL
jgi:hypothetical protein